MPDISIGKSHTTFMPRSPVASGSAVNEGSTLDAALIALEQQLTNTLPAGPLQERALQAHQDIRGLLQRFEQRTGQPPASRPVRATSSALESLRQQQEAALSHLTESVKPLVIDNPAAIKNAAAAGIQNSENQHSAMKQLQTAESLYRQKRAVNAAAAQREPNPWPDPWPGPPPAADFKSDFYMFWEMQEDIKQIDSSYIKAYEHIMGGNKTAPLDPEGYTGFFNTLSKAMNDKTKFLKASTSSDAGRIHFDYSGFRSQFLTAMDKYLPPGFTAPLVPRPAGDNGISLHIYSHPLPDAAHAAIAVSGKATSMENPDLTTRPPDNIAIYFLEAIDFDERTTDLLAQAAVVNYWKENLGAGFYVQQGTGLDGKQKIYVYADTSIVADMVVSITNSFFSIAPNEIMQQTYSSWETAWNGNQTTVTNTTQRIGDLYSSANRTFDNLTRIMTSAFQSCVDCAKDFLRV